MNIAINTRLLLAGRMEGIGRYTYETTRRLVALNPEHHFYFLFDRDYDEQFVFGDNVTPIVLGPPTRHPLLILFWFEYRVTRFLKKNNIDVFISGDMFLSLRTKVPTLLISHDLGFEHFPEHLPKTIAKFYQKYSIRYHQAATKIVAVSKVTKQDIIDRYGIDAAKIEVGYNACPDGFAPVTSETKFAVRQKRTNGVPYFVYVGSLHPRKNIKGLFQAFESYKSKAFKDCKLVIIGRKAWKYEEIDRFYESMKFKDDVIFLDHVEEGIQDIVGSAEAMIYVSFFEGFGIPIIEAFNAGVPVITSNVSSMPEVAGDAAILIDPYEPKEIAGAMHRIMLEPNLKETLIQKAHVQKLKFDWNQTAQLISDEMNNLGPS